MGKDDEDSAWDGAVILFYFISTLTIFITGIILSNADATVYTVYACSIIVFSMYFCQCCLCSPVCFVFIAIGKIVNLICSIILATRCFKMKSEYDNKLLNREYMNRDEKKYLQWASKNHLILAIASIINSILIVLFSIVLAKVVKNSADDSESNAAENNEEQNNEIEPPNARSDFAEFNQTPLLNQTTHPEPSAPPISTPSGFVRPMSVASEYDLPMNTESGFVPPMSAQSGFFPPMSEQEISVPPISNVEAPPPRYEDIYKTTKN